MFRLEPDAEFQCRESRPSDPRDGGFDTVERSYFLITGAGSAEAVELSPGFGQAIAAGLHERPQPMGRAEDRYWWIFGDRIYSTPDRLSRAAVLRLAECERLGTQPRSWVASARPSFERSGALATQA